MSPLLAREPISIVTACDENYARAAAATLVSAVANTPTQRALKLYVLDGGVSPLSKTRLDRTCAALGHRITWLRPKTEALSDLSISGHVSLATYLRLFLAELMPPSVTQAIYLDADAIVVQSLENLWSMDLNNSFCGAVQDSLFPVLEPTAVYGRQLHCQSLAEHDPHPIANYRELGLPAAAPYFNAGVLLVNVDRWRRDRVASRALTCLRKNANYVRFWDQYALNVLFAEQWCPLDARWNQCADLFRLPSWQASHYSEAEFRRLRRDPWIIHFNNLPKPWSADCDHPFQSLYWHYAQQTAWSQARANTPTVSFSRAA